MGGGGLGELTINRENLCALMCDPAYKVRDIARGARRVDVRITLP